MWYLAAFLNSLCERSITINTQYLTHRNFVSIVANLVVGALVFWTQPGAAQTVAPEVVTQTTEKGAASVGTALQQKWLSASVNERMKLAEQLGDDGARAFAKAKRWTPVFDGVGRGVTQGPDQVYQAADNVVHVIEAKGGSGQLGRAYGHAQGSSEWAVESAKRVLRHPRATEAERRGAAKVLKAAAKGKLQVHVVRTGHVLGEPTAAVLEQTVRSSDKAARLASLAIDDAGRAAAGTIDDLSRFADDAARTVSKGRTILKVTAKIAVPLAVAVDGGLRMNDAVKVERQYERGALTAQQREIAHSKNVAGMAGGWCCALAGAKLGAIGGGAVGTAIAPGPGTAVGGIAVGVTGGVVGYLAGEAAAEAAAEWTVNRVHAAGTMISDATESTAVGFKRAWNWAWAN